MLFFGRNCLCSILVLYHIHKYNGRPINYIFIVFSNEPTGKNNRAYGFNAGDPLRMQTEAVSRNAVLKIIIRHKRDAAIAGKRW